MKFPPDLNGILLAFVVTPMIWTYFILSASAIPDIFNAVLKNGLLSQKDFNTSYKYFLHRIETSFNHRIWFITSMGMAILLSGFQVTVFWPNNPYLWYEPQKHVWYGALEISTYTLSQYMVLAVITRQFITIFWLNRLFQEFDIVVWLNHPDKSGGWFAVGRQAAALSVFVVAIAIWAVSLAISPQLPTIYSLPLQILVWTLFTLLAPIAFLLPMLSTHRAMREYKQCALGEISQPINALLNEARTSELIKKSNKKAFLEEIETLRSWYKMIDEGLPDWPFSMDLLRRVGATWVLPLAIGIFSTVMQYAVSKFLP